MSIGRGRGRGRGWIQDDKDLSPKPGRRLHTEDVGCNTNLVNIVNSTTNKNMGPQFQEFLKLIDNNFKETYDKLHEYARNNKEFGKNLVRFVQLSSLYKKSLPKTDQTEDWYELTKFFMTALQNNYEERIEIRQKDTGQFYNDIHLLSEYMFHYKTKDYLGHMAVIISKALLDYMEMLLETASIEEIQMFTKQITVHGKFMCAVCENEMDKLMIMTRQVLIKNDLPPISRQMLLYTIDLVNHDFKPLPKTLQEFYELQLGKNFISVGKNTEKNQLDALKDQSVPLSDQN